MTTQQVADKLAEYCRNGEFEAAQQELYAENVVSTEPYDMPDFPKVTTGKEQVFAKIQKFNAMIEEAFSFRASEPIVSGNAIAMILGMDITMKGKERMDMNEIAVYEVKDGKVVSETFYV